MKKIKVAVVAVVLVLTLLLLVACAPSDKMLATYDDDVLIASSNSSFTLKKVSITINAKFSCKAESFTGCSFMKEVEINDNPIVNLELEIIEGDFKIVFVASDNTVYTVVEESFSGSIETQIPAGRYSVKMVGRYAKIDLKFSYNFSY